VVHGASAGGAGSGGAEVQVQRCRTVKVQGAGTRCRGTEVQWGCRY